MATISLSLKTMNQTLVQNGTERGTRSNTVMKNALPMTYQTQRKKFKEIIKNIFHYNSDCPLMVGNDPDLVSL